MKAYKKQEVLQFKFLNEVVVIETPNGPFSAGTDHVLLTYSNGKASAVPDAEFREQYEYVFKEGVSGECRRKRKIIDVTRTTMGSRGYLISDPIGGASVIDEAEFEEKYGLTHSDEHIVAAFREIDAGMAHNCHLSHANVVMISRDHYAALCDLAYGLPKQLS